MGAFGPARAGIVIYLLTGVVRSTLVGLIVAVFGAGILSVLALDSLLPWQRPDSGTAAVIRG